MTTLQTTRTLTLSVVQHPPPEHFDLVALGTMIASAALAFLTAALVYYTWRLAEATRIPSIVVTIEPTEVSMMHLDLHVENEGTAAAYEIEIAFEPEIPLYSESRKRPLQKVSVLKAGQRLASSLNQFALVEHKSFEARISWSRRKCGKRYSKSYTINMEDLQGYGRLGVPALRQIADEIKNIREDWRWHASGSRRFQVDAFSLTERLHERRSMERQMRRQDTRLRAQSAQSGDAASTAD